MNGHLWTFKVEEVIEKTETYPETIIKDVFRTQWNIKDEAFCKNSCLHLTVDHFCKTLHITYITGLWTCLDKTKQDCNLCKFTFKLCSIYQFIFTLPWDNHKLKTRAFHFKLIYPFSRIHVILVSHYLPVQTHRNGKEIERKLHSIVLLANSVNTKGRFSKLVAILSARS